MPGGGSVWRSLHHVGEGGCLYVMKGERILVYCFSCQYQIAYFNIKSSLVLISSIEFLHLNGPPIKRPVPISQALCQTRHLVVEFLKADHYDVMKAFIYLPVHLFITNITLTLRSVPVCRWGDRQLL